VFEREKRGEKGRKREREEGERERERERRGCISLLYLLKESITVSLTGCLKQQKFIFSSSGGWKYKTKVSADLVPPEGLWLGDSLLLSVPLQGCPSVHALSSVSSFFEDTCHIG
jgi:hypothetical protein